MSILPSQNIGSASSSSSQAHSQIPNSHHGFAFLQRQQPEISQYPVSLFRETESLKSLRVSESESESFIGPSNNISGLLAPTAEGYCQSSEKVSESGKLNGKTFLVHQKSGESSHYDAAVRGDVPSTRHRAVSQAVVSSHSHEASGTISRQPSAMNSSGRKTQMVNGNHLLNFHYDPISHPQPRAPPSRRQQKRKPYNKDLFLQANYKFVVLDSGNHAPQLLNPDKMLQWEDIVCVRFSTPFPLQCPICLEDPLCPQITSCGHIFCFPCILRYFSLGEDDHKGECWKKCPICFMMISSKDFCTIYIENVKHLQVGDIVEFMLLTRHKDSFVLSLKNKQGMGTNEEAPDSFSKFNFTSDVDLSVRNAISDLDSWLARVDSGLEDDLEKLPFVCAAMEQLEQRKKYWNERRVCNGSMIHKCIGSQIVGEASPPASITVADKEACNWESPSAFIDGKSTEVSESNLCKLHGEACLDFVVNGNQASRGQEGALSSSYENSKNLKRHLNGIGDRMEKDSYNFYQAVDGQHLILHPLNMKCLLHHYGGYEMLPHRISGKVLQLESVTQSEAMRRRYRFLSHFSLTTTFQLCEIDLSEMLPSDALSPFMDEIKNREKQRKRLARKEQKEKIKAETASTQDFVVHFQSDPPTFTMDDFEALGSSAATSSSPPTVGERKLFSNVARLGFAAGYDSPALRANEPQSSSKPEMISSSSSVIGPSHRGTPTFANVTSRSKPSEGLDATKGSKLGKKGRKPSHILLSTAGARHY